MTVGQVCCTECISQSSFIIFLRASGLSDTAINFMKNLKKSLNPFDWITWLMFQKENKKRKNRWKRKKIQKKITVGDYKLIEMAKIVKIKQQVTFGSVYELENVNSNPFPLLFPLQTRNFVSNF